MIEVVHSCWTCKRRSLQLVGANVGISVGDGDGTDVVGVLLGMLVVGDGEGSDVVGSLVGIGVGESVGDRVGSVVVGPREGVDVVGDGDGSVVTGAIEGFMLGAEVVGVLEGLLEGVVVVGAADGDRVGEAVLSQQIAVLSKLVPFEEKFAPISGILNPCAAFSTMGSKVPVRSLNTQTPSELILASCCAPPFKKIGFPLVSSETSL